MDQQFFDQLHKQMGPAYTSVPYQCYPTWDTADQKLKELKWSPTEVRISQLPYLPWQERVWTTSQFASSRMKAENIVQTLCRSLQPCSPSCNTIPHVDAHEAPQKLRQLERKGPTVFRHCIQTCGIRRNLSKFVDVQKPRLRKRRESPHGLSSGDGSKSARFCFWCAGNCRWCGGCGWRGNFPWRAGGPSLGKDRGWAQSAQVIPHSTADCGMLTRCNSIGRKFPKSHQHTWRKARNSM